MKHENQLQAWVRLNSQSEFQSLMMRNNSGSLPNPHTGVPVRFGLGNDSKQTNAVFKSSDLIGITPVKCPCDRTYGVFTAIETKIPGWVPNLNNLEYIGQQNFISIIKQKSGIAGFIQSKDDFYNVYNNFINEEFRSKKMQITFDPSSPKERGVVRGLIDQFSIDPMQQQAPAPTTAQQMLTPAPTTAQQQQAPAPTTAQQQQAPAPTTAQQQQAPAPTTAQQQQAPAPTTAQRQQQMAVHIDSSGVPWNVEIHTSTKNMTGKGLWKRKKGVDVEIYDNFAAKFQVASSAPVAQAVQETDMLSEIDDIFADLDESNHMENFSSWVSSLLDWAKPGAKTISDLENDLGAQQKLFDHLQTIQ